MEDWKIKIAVLWIFGIITALTTMFVMLLEPGVIEQVIAGELKGQEIRPEVLLVLAIIVLIPLVMAFLSLVLKNSVNRWANIIVGIAFLIFGLSDLPKYLAISSAYAVLLDLSGVAASALIVWYAWKSKQNGTMSGETSKVII